jgi:hypothetical protein
MTSSTPYGITETGSGRPEPRFRTSAPKMASDRRGAGRVVRVLKSKSTDMPPAFAEECAPGEPLRMGQHSSIAMRLPLIATI